ncbi:hypothetical protein DFQ27_004614 [Actinomortierella ambigua]|uniref:N-acetyltransferase domain-containing protein n=1 Tax=Actinomortierella ambigua TaxID=1343610 RepID=A0A9P6Q4V0_9FUNG|nr:hypothetical protein DFQ27_004614 [Actinomortierella ambigua]
MSPGKTMPAALEQDDSKSMFHLIPLEDLQAEYLPSLVPTLPETMCQIGMVMTTLYTQEHGQTSDPDSITAKMSEDPCAHYRSTPFPSPASESQPTTVYHLTMSRVSRSCYIIANTEANLKAALTAHGVDYAKDESEEDAATREAREAKIKADVYIQEQFEIFRTVAREVVKMLNEGVDAETAKTPVYFCSINRIWFRAVTSLYPTIHREGPAIKFAISEKDLLAAESNLLAEMQAIADRKGWTFGPMKKSDAPLMIEKNSLKYDLEYGEHVAERSVCFRDQAGNMVAWAGSHFDLAVAALYVLPEYRKEGLGRLILYYVNMVHAKRLRELLNGTSQSTVDPSLLYMHADTEAYNVPTQKFMLRCGYKIVNYTNWFTIVPIEGN